jgi:hypothetical protein
MTAIRVCMERLVPPIKHQPVAVELPPIEKPADSVEAVASIAAAVAAGDLTAAEAAELAKVVDVYVRALDSKGFRPLGKGGTKSEIKSPAHLEPRAHGKTTAGRRTLVSD